MQHGKRGTELATNKRPNLWKEGKFPGSYFQASCKREQGSWEKIHLKLKWMC